MALHNAFAFKLLSDGGPGVQLLAHHWKGLTWPKPPFPRSTFSYNRPAKQVCQCNESLTAKGQGPRGALTPKASSHPQG